jgi:putative flippase GtrA
MKIPQRPALVRFVRYTAGSVLASLASAVTIVIVYGVVGSGAGVAAVAAFVTGATVAFIVNRFWAWRGRETDSAGRDLVRYWLVVVATAVIALACTHFADAYAKDHGLTGAIRTVVVEGAYFGSYAVTFVAKFFVLDRFVFTSTRALRSRVQVENTTRA